MAYPMMSLCYPLLQNEKCGSVYGEDSPTERPLKLLIYFPTVVKTWYPITFNPHMSIEFVHFEYASNGEASGDRKP